jgi:hypothetical protein
MPNFETKGATETGMRQCRNPPPKNFLISGIVNMVAGRPKSRDEGLKEESERCYASINQKSDEELYL